MTRWMRRPTTFGSVEEALADTVENYRKALWRRNPGYVEIWCEKDALAGVIHPVTDEFACDLDASPPDELRELVTKTIERHLPQYELAQMKLIEQEERETWLTVIGNWNPGG